MIYICLGPRPISEQFIRSVILLFQVHFPKFQTVNPHVAESLTDTVNASVNQAMPGPSIRSVQIISICTSWNFLEVKANRNTMRFQMEIKLPMFQPEQSKVTRSSFVIPHGKIRMPASCDILCVSLG